MRWGQVGRAAKARGVVISANFAVGLRAHPTFLTLVSPDQPNPSATLIAVIYGTIGRSSAPQSGAARTADLRDRVRQLGLAEMRRGIAICREQGQLVWLSAAEAALAIAEASAGETDAGLRRLDDALAESGRTEQHWYEAEIHRIRAGILLKRDPADNAAVEQSLQA